MCYTPSIGALSDTNGPMNLTIHHSSVPRIYETWRRAQSSPDPDAHPEDVGITWGSGDEKQPTMGRFDVRARHLSTIYELFDAQHYTRPRDVDAVQHTKEPLHAAYLNMPSLETRNCQSLLSSFLTSARHSATHGYATNQDHAASLSRHRRACSCKDGTLVGELGISALTGQTRTQ